MNKIIYILLLMICMSSIVFAEAGSYQLMVGKYLQVTANLQKGETERDFQEGLFRINTETGLVEYYSEMFVIDKEDNITIETSWKALKNSKGKVNKEGEMLK